MRDPVSEIKVRANEMVLPGKALACRPADLTSVLRSHKVEREN